MSGFMISDLPMFCRFLTLIAELRTAPLEDFPKSLRRKTRKLYPCARKSRCISTAAITTRFPASSLYPSGETKAYDSRENAITDLSKDGMGELLAGHGSWDSNRHIIVVERGVEHPTGRIRQHFYLPLQK